VHRESFPCLVLKLISDSAAREVVHHEVDLAVLRVVDDLVELDYIDVTEFL
jgi:hypothetical protein